MVVCMNDTLGRIAFYLRFHDNAVLTQADTDAIGKWAPHFSKHPPKMLADLFEAYVGAVYVQHGWTKVQTWLDRLFVPIVKAATGDYWNSVSPAQFLGITPPRTFEPNFTHPKAQDQLLNYVEFKGEKLRDGARLVLDLLPVFTKFQFDRRTGRLQEPDVDRVEVATHLINMWVCQVVNQQCPEYNTARARAAHLFTVRLPTVQCDLLTIIVG